MAIIFYISAGLFLAKLLWNQGVPYDLAWRSWKSGGKSLGGISLMPLVEVCLLLMAIGTSALYGGKIWLPTPKQVAIWGAVAIMISYLHMAIAGFLMGWIVARSKK